MSRSGYNDCIDDDNRWQWIRWRGAVNSAIKGRRGQVFLRRMIRALDALPEKRLVADGPVKPDGCCAIGSVILNEGLSRTESRDSDLACMLDVAPAMLKEIMFENDDDFGVFSSDDEKRWQRMRNWAEYHLQAD